MRGFDARIYILLLKKQVLCCVECIKTDLRYLRRASRLGQLSIMCSYYYYYCYYYYYLLLLSS